MSKAQQIRVAIEKQQKEGIKPEKVKFFGQEVYVWPLSSYEMESWRAYVKSKDESEVRKNVAKLIQISLRTEDGLCLYQPEAVDLIAGFRPAIELDKIEEVVMRVNGYGAAGIKEIVKNLPETPGDSGSPDSPESTDAAKQNL